MPDSTVNYRTPPTGGIVPTEAQFHDAGDFVVADVDFPEGGGPVNVVHGLLQQTEHPAGFPLVTITPMAMGPSAVAGLYTVVDANTISVALRHAGASAERPVTATFRVTIQRAHLRRGIFG